VFAAQRAEGCYIILLLEAHRLSVDIR